jgi:glycerol-3-phosphate dehydrogenase
MRPRTGALQNAANDSFDVCVIGGGATGSGCALDAQLRGLKTILVDGGDFASGASSASTKMAHGGVRYLEKAVRRLDRSQYEVVKRALHERVRMLHNAPFLARTRRFVTPCYRWRDVAYYEIGLKLYDWLAGKAGLASSRFLSREETLRRIPMLNPEGLVGAVAYTDGQFDDARYNITLVETLSGAGGEALNYARVVAFEKSGEGGIRAAEIEDRFSGKRLSVRARVFVNATGPFADTVREMATPGAARRMRPSKGAHVLLPRELLTGRIGKREESADPTRASTVQESLDALLIPKTEDGRVLFAIPWMGRLLVGTTDEEIDQPEAAGVSSSEAEYLLRHLNRYLVRPVKPEQIVSAFAGARPLVSSLGSPADEAKELARDHVVEMDAGSGLVSIMGGKWTTYRAMAEDTIDAVERQLHGGPPVPCRTSNYPLAGSEGFTADSWRHLMAAFGIPETSARHLSEKFGSRARQVLALAGENRGLAASLAHGLAPLKVEVIFCARYEMARSIEDVLARRIGLESYGWREALAAAPAAAELLATELRWTPEQKRRALEQYVARIERQMRELGTGD